jgi:hypothetical protein
MRGVADPEKMAQMFARPSYAAQDWVHLCTWDYFVGQWIYLQGLDKGLFTRLSLLVTFNAGMPPLALCIQHPCHTHSSLLPSAHLMRLSRVPVWTALRTCLP